MLAVTLPQVLCSAFIEGYRDFQNSHLWMTWVALSLAIVLQITLVCARKVAALFPYNMLLLFLFALLQGYVASSVAAAVGP
jgi:hypothetical protein